MPLPRRLDPARNGDSERPPPRTEPVSTGRAPTQAEAQRRYRHGHRSGHGRVELVWDEPPRNGLPAKPYRYNGLGYDAITGETDDE